MDLKKLRYLIVLAVIAIGGFLLAQGNSIGFVALFLVGYALILYIDRRAKKSWEPLYDERDYAVAALASRTAIIVYTYVIGFAILALYIANTLGMIELSESMMKTISVFLVSIFILFVIYTISWLYYRWKFGG